MSRPLRSAPLLFAALLIALGGLPMASGASAAVLPTSISVPVATADWKATGVSPAKGTKIAITATGSGMYCGSDTSCTAPTPAGDPDQGSICDGGYDAIGAACIALVGSWDQEAAFVIGAGTTLTAPGGKQLHLGIHDWKFDDNSGTYTVRIKKATEPKLALAIRTSSPHGRTVSAGDVVRYTLQPSASGTTGSVELRATLPAARFARLLPATISEGAVRRGADLVWTFSKGQVRRVSFSVMVRSDITFQDPFADDARLGVVASLALLTRLDDAVVVQQYRDLLPCGQRAIDHPKRLRSLSAAGWTFRAGIDPRYGFVLEDLRLRHLDGSGARMVAPRISLPYLQVRTTATTAKQSDALIRLRPDGAEAFGRSRLLRLDLDASDAKVRAVYGVDHLGAGSGSCLLVAASFEFKAYGADADCHPAAKVGFGQGALVKCSQFRPLLEYRFRGADGEELEEVLSAQRLLLDLDDHGWSNAMVRDRDLANSLPTNGNILLAKWVNPVTVERQFVAIDRGAAGPWDNFHQRSNEPRVDLPADLEDGIALACGECLHIHWRWGRVAGGDLPGLGGAKPIIRSGSRQDAYVSLVKPRAAEEGRLVRDLVDGDRWDPERNANGRVAFYWVAASGREADAFFVHWAWAVPLATAPTAASAVALAQRVPAAADFVCPIPSIGPA